MDKYLQATNDQGWKPDEYVKGGPTRQEIEDKFNPDVCDCGSKSSFVAHDGARIRCAACGIDLTGPVSFP